MPPLVVDLFKIGPWSKNLDRHSIRDATLISRLVYFENFSIEYSFGVKSQRVRTQL